MECFLEQLSVKFVLLGVDVVSEGSVYLYDVVHWCNEFFNQIFLDFFRVQTRQVLLEEIRETLTNILPDSLTFSTLTKIYHQTVKCLWDIRSSFSLV